MTQPLVARIVRVVGVYDADHTVRGEIAYWIGARLGRRHCSLCDITHGSLLMRSEWKACRAGMPVPFDTFHRDDQPEAVRAAAAGRTPVVVVETSAGYTVLLGESEIAACEGSIDRLVEAIESAVERQGVAWPS